MTRNLKLAHEVPMSIPRVICAVGRLATLVLVAVITAYSIARSEELSNSVPLQQLEARLKWKDNVGRMLQSFSGQYLCRIVALNDEYSPLAAQCLNRSFDLDALYPYFIKPLRESASAADLNAALVFLEHPIIRKVYSLQSVPPPADYGLQLDQIWAAVQSGDISPRRAQCIQSLNEVTGSILSRTAFKLGVRLMLRRAVNEARTPRNRVSDAELQARLETERPGLLAAEERTDLVKTLFKYRSLTDQELEQYLNLASAPAIRKFNIASNNGYDDCLKRHLATVVPCFAREIVKKLPENIR